VLNLAVENRVRLPGVKEEQLPKTLITRNQLVDIGEARRIDIVGPQIDFRHRCVYSPFSCTDSQQRIDDC
jgi:hypothetical protein